MSREEDNGTFKTEVEKMGFEEAMSQLEKVVRELERGELSLEESMRAFQEAVQLSRHCRDILAQAEFRVEYLLQKEGWLEGEESAGEMNQKEPLVEEEEEKAEKNEDKLFEELEEENEGQG